MCCCFLFLCVCVCVRKPFFFCVSFSSFFFLISPAGAKHWWVPSFSLFSLSLYLSCGYCGGSGAQRTLFPSLSCRWPFLRFPLLPLRFSYYMSRLHRGFPSPHQPPQTHTPKTKECFFFSPFSLFVSCLFCLLGGASSSWRPLHSCCVESRIKKKREKNKNKN